MNNSINYTSLDRVLAKISRDIGSNDIHKDDIIEWVGEALGYINSTTILEEHIEFLPVRNYTADMPDYFKMMIQVGYDTEGDISNFEEHISKCYQERDIEMETIKLEREQGCLDCCEEEQKEYRGDYRTYGKAYSLYHDWKRTKFYKERFTPVRLSNNTLFKSMVCSGIEHEGVHIGNSLEYTIVGVVDKKLRFSFKTGVVAVAFLRNMIDPETGYPIIPDDEKALAALTYYVKWKYAERMVFSRKEGFKYISEDNERKWNSYIKKFNNSAKMPKTLDDYQNLLNQTFQIVPNMNKYNNFFGKFRHGR